jgi:hypothetical protein
MILVRLRLEQMVPRHPVAVGYDLAVLLRAEELLLHETRALTAVVALAHDRLFPDPCVAELRILPPSDPTDPTSGSPVIFTSLAIRYPPTVTT